MQRPFRLSDAERKVRGRHPAIRMGLPIAIRVENLSKAYTMWSSPAARLHGPLLGRLGQLPFLPNAARAVCRRLSHEAFRNFYALRNVSFEVRQGDSIAIIGRNGSGKSTLLQILAGTLRPSEGEVAVDGSVAALLELGSGFDPDFTGRENVYLNAAIRGLTRRETDAKFAEIAEFAGIGEFIDQAVKTYSSGMVVRLAFAVSACLRPEVLIVDEALSVGDIFFQQKCLRHMEERMQGVTKVLVTHDLQAVLRATNAAYVLDRGVVVFAGSSQAAVEFYVKMAHNEPSLPPLAMPSLAAPTPAASPDRRMFDELPWREVVPAERSGAGNIRIDRVAVTDAAGRPVGTVQAGDRIVVRSWVTCLTPTTHVLAGYILTDRVGNWICGENTCSVPDGVFPLATGEHVIQLEFDWPEIQPGDYTITPGIGEGTLPLQHVIQCWAHHVAKFTAISPHKAVHCMFNNPLKGLQVSSLDGGASGRAVPVGT